MTDKPAENIAQMLDETARAHPDHPAIVDVPSGSELSYAKLKAQVEVLARGFLALGLAPGERLTLWAPNRPEWLICWLAACKAGLITSSLDASLGAEELAYQLEHSQSRLLVHARGLDGSEHLDVLRGLCPQADAPRRDRLGCEKFPRLDFLLALDGGLAGAYAWDQLMDLGQGVDPARLAEREAAIRPEDAATLLYTSGTTGKPKGVLSPHIGLLGPTRTGVANQGLGPADRLCVSVPFSHMFGCICLALAGLMAGSTLVIPARRPEPEAILAAIASEKCTAIYGPPTAFIAMMDLPDFRGLDLGSLRTGIMAGAPCPLEIMKKVVNQMGVSQVLIGYGQTEASSWVSLTSPKDPLELRVSSVGRPVAGAEVRIIDPASGEEVPAGEVGEICVRGHNMLGYLDNPAATAQALDPAGWLHTGDVGSMDPGGYIRISGRLKEVIRKAGRAVFPTDLEEILFSHPKVNNVQVFGVPHPELGEEVAAWLRLEQGQAAEPAEFLEFLRARVPEAGLPDHVRFVEEFPMTPLGKIQKFRMRQIMADELGRELA